MVDRGNRSRKTVSVCVDMPLNYKQTRYYLITVYKKADNMFTFVLININFTIIFDIVLPIFIKIKQYKLI